MSFVPSRVNANNVKFFPPLRYTVGKTTVYLKLETGATSTDSLSPKLLAFVIRISPSSTTLAHNHATHFDVGSGLPRGMVPSHMLN